MRRQPSDVSPAASILRTWAQAFNATDLATIVALYDDDALLWGTTATSVIDTHSGIEAYFDAVFSMRPSPQVMFTSAVERCHGETTLVAGTYTLELAAAGLASRLPARYSFTLRHRDGQWRIAQHHSSMLPSGALSNACPP